MAKFFFNFRQGNSYQADDLGCEFETVEAAYLGAFAAAQDMWRELLIKREDPLLCAFEVMDQAGNDLFTVPFLEVLDVCRGRVHRPMQQAPRPHHVQQAMDNRREAERVLSEVSSTVASTRSTLRQTWSLLDQVAKLAAG